MQNLLDLAKMDMGVELKMENVELNTLATDIADEFQPQAEAKNQTLNLKKAWDEIVVRGDPLQLCQALRNLVGNAIKYTPADGSIDLSVEKEETSVFIQVKDTGHGIPADDLPFIFDRFYRVRNQTIQNIEGNGLGLAIVKSIIEKHGGQISVESEPGKGSCFTFSLPLAPGEALTGSILKAISN